MLYAKRFKSHRLVSSFGVVGCAALLLVGACSSPVQDCNPPIPAGAKFMVTRVAEAEESHKCHIIEPLNEFQVQAAPADVQALGARCEYTPGAWAPEQRSVSIIDCRSQGDAMLASSCEFKYPSTCAGTIDFSFESPQGAELDWSAANIDGALFKIRDYATSCLPDRANCIDVWKVNLRRVQ